MSHWATIETEDYVVVFPDNDTGPHGARVTDKEYDLNSATCACRPKVQIEAWHQLGDDTAAIRTYGKALVVHNAFDGRM